MRIHKYALIYIICFFAIVSCNSEITPAYSEQTSIPTSSTQQVESNCIPPLVNFSYFPTGGERQGPKPPENMLPSKDWVFVSSIPDMPSVDQSITPSAHIELIQHLGGKDEVWINITDIKNKLIRYQIKNNQWLNVENIEGVFSFPSSLFLDKNDVVWIFRDVVYNFELNVDTPLLSVYDEKSKNFSAILKVTDFIDNQNIAAVSSIGILNLSLDSNGDFWFAVLINFENQEDRYQLIKFSPLTHELTRHLKTFELGKYYLSFVIDPNNIIYLLDGADKSIIRYEPIKNKTSRIEIPDQVVTNTNSGTPNVLNSNLFLDSHHRLWIDDRGWLDLTPNGDWHIVIRSPIFISYMYYGSGLWFWEHPTFSNESADGRLWYLTSNRGTGWVEPNSGKWCMFTTYQSGVVKDSDGNLWIVADGKLYKNSIHP